jgi:hypothetical protein
LTGLSIVQKKPTRTVPLLPEHPRPAALAARVPALQQLQGPAPAQHLAGRLAQIHPEKKSQADRDLLRRYLWRYSWCYSCGASGGGLGGASGGSLKLLPIEFRRERLRRF